MCTQIESYSWYCVKNVLGVLGPFNDRFVAIVIRMQRIGDGLIYEQNDVRNVSPNLQIASNYSLAHIDRMRFELIGYITIN